MIGRYPDGDRAARGRAVTQPKPLPALAGPKRVDATAHPYELAAIAFHLRGVDRHVAWLDQTGCAWHDGHASGNELEIAPVALDGSGGDEAVSFAYADIERAREDADTSTRVL